MANFRGQKVKFTCGRKDLAKGSKSRQEKLRRLGLVACLKFQFFARFKKTH